MHLSRMKKATAPFLVTAPTNIRYLTGFVDVDTRDAYVLKTERRMYLFTNSLYLEQAKKLKTTVIEISRDNPLSKQLAKVLKKENIRKLEFEEHDLTVAEYNKLKKELPGVPLVPAQNRIEDIRMIKRAGEIENIRQAANLTDACFDFILGKLKPGVTEMEITWEIERFIRSPGSDLDFPIRTAQPATMAFCPIVAFGKNSSQPHYSPGLSGLGSDLKKGQTLSETPRQTLSHQDLVLLDFGARVNGYCADMTRVVFLGTPKPEWVRAYEVVFAAQQKALDYLASHIGGVKLGGAEADRRAREEIRKAGLPPYPHSLGHAVGLDIHEAPRLTMKKPTILKPNMVITIEPGVYIEGQYGIRIEDLILLRENDIEILSKSPKEMIVL